MTDFNSLPLAEQLKALQAGDELHLRGGGWLPFVEHTFELICSHRDFASWYSDGRGNNKKLDIIRVVRLTERKVPELVERLRQFSCRQLAGRIANGDGINTPSGELAYILADHFEKGEKP